MSQRKTILLLVFCLFLVCFSNTYVFAIATDQESLTVTTYYPAPRGAFKELRLEPIPSANCTVNDEGKVYYNSTNNQLEICYTSVINNTTTPIVSPLPGPGGGCSFWVKSGINDIVNTNAGSVNMTHFQVGNTNLTDVDLQINGRWKANTPIQTGNPNHGMEVYPVISSTAGTAWYAHYSTYGPETITMGAWYNYVFENFVINDEPTCCGNVGIGTRYPRAKLHVAYPNGYAGTSDYVFAATNESSYGGTYSVGLALHRLYSQVMIGDWGNWGINGKLSVIDHNWNRQYPNLVVRGHNYGQPVVIDSGSRHGACQYKGYIGFNIYYDGQSNIWRTYADLKNNTNGGAIIFSSYFFGDLGFKTIKNTGGASQSPAWPLNVPDLYINPSGQVSVNGTNSNGRQFYVNGSAGGTSAWACASDLRLKHNIRNLNNGLSKILKLRGVNFEWIDPDYGRPGKMMGVIAQETIKFVPEAVSRQNQTYYTELDQLVPVLIASTKEQQSQIEDLKKELEIINKLKTKIKR